MWCALSEVGLSMSYVLETRSVSYANGGVRCVWRALSEVGLSMSYVLETVSVSTLTLGTVWVVCPVRTVYVYSCNERVCVVTSGGSGNERCMRTVVTNGFTYVVTSGGSGKEQCMRTVVTNGFTYVVRSGGSGNERCMRTVVTNRFTS